MSPVSSVSILPRHSNLRFAGVYEVVNNRTDPILLPERMNTISERRIIHALFHVLPVQFYTILREAGLNPVQPGMTVADQGRLYYVSNDDLGQQDATPFLDIRDQIAEICGQDWSWERVFTYLDDGTREPGKIKRLAGLMKQFSELAKGLEERRPDGNLIVENAGKRLQRLA
jgi:hypothetical protein